MEFGQTIKEKYFPHIAKLEHRILNVGSFGISPMSVIKTKTKYIEHNEAFGDDFARRHLLPLYMKSIESVADLFNIQPKQCVLVDNVTTGVASILKSIMKPGDGILLHTWTYGGVKLSANYHVNQMPNTKVYTVKLHLPILSKEDIVEKYRAELEAHPDIRIVVIDYITSSPTCVLPAAELTTLCKQYGAIVIIDGAHAVGQIQNLDIESLGADFFLGALHKWLFAPKSSALMWMKEKYLSVVNPVTVSWFIHDPEIQYKFAFLGTRDISSFLCLPEAIQFIQETCGGSEKIYEYCSQLADKGSEYLVKFWNTEVLPVPAEMQAPYLRMIKLPKQFQTKRFLQMTQESRLYSKAWKFGFEKLKLDLMCTNIENTAYIRVSFAIIVTMEDIHVLGESLAAVNENDFD